MAIAFNWFDFAVGGVLASILAAVVTTAIRAWYPRLASVFRRHFSSRPGIHSFRCLLESHGFKGKPKKWHPHYYVRSSRQVDSDLEQRKETYKFLAGMDIEQFMGFLIPPLDFGHGRRRRATNPDRDKIDDAWLSYLGELGKKADKARGKSFRPSFFNLRYLHEARRKAKDLSEDVVPVKVSRRKKFEFEARRIIFFDKRLVQLFTLEPEWIFNEGGRELSSRFLDDILQYIRDIVRIHEAIAGYAGIECFYLDQSHVTTDLYYDFGLYVVEGVPVVYQPVGLWDQNRSIQDQKVLIGDSARQLRGIEKFVVDFERLWGIVSASEPSVNSFRAEHSDPSVYVTSISGYLEFNCLSLELFGLGYYKRMSAILHDYEKKRA